MRSSERCTVPLRYRCFIEPLASTASTTRKRWPSRRFFTSATETSYLRRFTAGAPGAGFVRSMRLFAAEGGAGGTGAEGGAGGTGAEGGAGGTGAEGGAGGTGAEGGAGNATEEAADSSSIA